MTRIETEKIEAGLPGCFLRSVSVIDGRITGITHVGVTYLERDAPDPGGVCPKHRDVSGGVCILATCIFSYEK